MASSVAYIKTFSTLSGVSLVSLNFTAVKYSLHKCIEITLHQK